MSWFKREDHEIVNDSEKTVRTEKGELMQFLTFEDETAL